MIYYSRVYEWSELFSPGRCLSDITFYVIKCNGFEEGSVQDYKIERFLHNKLCTGSSMSLFCVPEYNASNTQKPIHTKFDDVMDLCKCKCTYPCEKTFHALNERRAHLYRSKEVTTSTIPKIQSFTKEQADFNYLSL